MKKVYLGDGVYLTINELGFTLTTENGVEVTNTIVLEPEVMAVLMAALIAKVWP